MLCPNCGQELSDLDTICPGCGQALSEAAEPSQYTASESAGSYGPPPIFWGSADDPGNPDNWETESTDDAEPQESQVANDTAKTDEPQKKRSVLPVILTAIIGLLVVIVVCLTITLTTLSSTGEMPGFVTAVSNWFENLGYDADAVAVNVTDQDGTALAEITNAQLSYYYWGEIYYYIQNNGIPFDASKPLDEQSYSDSQTWQDYFVDSACTSLTQTEALKAQAQAEDFEMSEQYQSDYDSTVDAMADYAVQTGFTMDDGTGDVLAYIQDSYGSSATIEGFQQYLYDSYYIADYSDTIYNGLSFSDQEIEDYFDENSEMFTTYGIEKSDVPNVNVRHILIKPEQSEDETEISAEAWNEAKEEAEQLLKEWKDGDATEESFADLATEHSTDGGSNTNGGLYEDVYPGQMVDTFNDWCFDSKRKAGDIGIVKTTYGYHIMYYVSATENYYWKTTAEKELHFSKYQEALAAIAEQYTSEPTKKLRLPMPDAIEALAAQSSSSNTANTAGAAG